METLDSQFRKNKQLMFISEMVCKFGFEQTINNRRLNYDTNSVSNVVEIEPTVTDQEDTGTCWIHAGLNMLVPYIVKNLKLDEGKFKFSSNYLFSRDKFESCKSFLEQMIELSDCDETEQALVDLLEKPTAGSDGGEWSSFLNLIKKYGVFPKGVMRGSKVGYNSSSIKEELRYFLRYCAKRIRDEYNNGISKEKLHNVLKKELLKQAHIIISVHFGLAPESISWTYETKDKKIKQLENKTPLQFLESVVNFPVNDYVELRTYPISEYKNYVKYNIRNERRKNVPCGDDTSYIKVPLSELKKCIMNAIDNNRTVYLGILMEDYISKSGVMDENDFNREKIYGFDFSLDKKSRLKLWHGAADHAMTVTGYHDPSKTGNPSKWKILNSWGKRKGDEGFMYATDEWFDEHVYEAVIFKEDLLEKIKNVEEEIDLDWNDLKHFIMTGK